MANPSPDLLPCPFCGGDAEIRSGSGWHGAGCNSVVAGVMCGGYCSARQHQSPEGAALAWNRRAAPPSPSTAPEVVDPEKRTGRQLMGQWNAGARELAERDVFEAWARDPIRASKLPLERWPTNGAYKDTRTYTAFYGWKAGRAALASRPAEVDCEGLPPLPVPLPLDDHTARYSAEQYRQGQRDAVAADRARREKGGA